MTERIWINRISSECFQSLHPDTAPLHDEVILAVREAQLHLVVPPARCHRWNTINFEAYFGRCVLSRYVEVHCREVSDEIQVNWKTPVLR